MMRTRPICPAAWVTLALALAAAAAPPMVRAADADPVKAFMDECGAKAAAAEKAGALAVAGKDGWLFLGAELRHLAVGRFWGDAAARSSRATKPECADPLPAILDFKAQLDKAGIELVLVPVPAKATVYPDMLSDRMAVAPGAAPPPVDDADRDFFEVLRAAGVKVIDLAPDFLANRFDKQGPLFCKQDSHWSGNGCVVAARRIAAEIKDRPWLAQVPKLQLASVWRTIDVAGDLVRPAAGQDTPTERVPIRFVGTKTGDEPELLDPSRTSPVVLLGDSSALVFQAGGDMYAVGAGLPDQLALELGFAVDLVAVRGSGVTAARINLYRRGLSDPNYLKLKRLVIWCFAARDFTESQGWPKVLIAKETPRG